MRFYPVLKSRKGKPINFKKIEKGIENLCKKFNISLFYIFGSYAKGKQNKLSDIDIAYLSEDYFDIMKEAELIEKLEDIFEDEGIDLINLKKAPLTLIHYILKEGKCIYAKNLSTKIDFETEKELEYLDTEWMRKEHFKKMIKRIKNGSFWN